MTFHILEYVFCMMVILGGASSDDIIEEQLIPVDYPEEAISRDATHSSVVLVDPYRGGYYNNYGYGYGYGGLGGYGPYGGFGINGGYGINSGYGGYGYGNIILKGQHAPYRLTTYVDFPPHRQGHKKQQIIPVVEDDSDETDRRSYIRASTGGSDGPEYTIMYLNNDQVLSGEQNDVQFRQNIGQDLNPVTYYQVPNTDRLYNMAGRTSSIPVGIPIKGTPLIQNTPFLSGMNTPRTIIPSGNFVTPGKATSLTLPGAVSETGWANKGYTGQNYGSYHYNSGYQKPLPYGGVAYSDVHKELYQDSGNHGHSMYNYDNRRPVLY